MDTKIGEKKRIHYECITCDFNSNDKTKYNNHLKTSKHKSFTNDIKMIQIDTRLEEKQDLHDKIKKKYDCKCGKSYKYSSGYYRHLNNCKSDKDDIVSSQSQEINYKDMFIELLKQNKELQNTICSTIQKIGNINNTNNITNNINNNNINVSVFLNDNCKDAISMNDFIDSVQINVTDLLYTGKKGLANGISNIFIERFNELPIFKRPLWCSDKKRHKLYIKEDEWSEDKDNQKTKEAIKKLCYVQTKNTSKYVKENPDWLTCDNKKDTYMCIIKQTTNDINEKMDKIISDISENAHLSNDIREKIASN